MFSLLDLRHPVVSPSRINGKDNVDNCSLPIMLLLLKQCQKFRILEELPDPSDTTNDADLTRINYYTTLIGDEKTPRSITTSNFNDIWNIVAEVYMFLITLAFGIAVIEIQWKCLYLNYSIEQKVKLQLKNQTNSHHI